MTVADPRKLAEETLEPYNETPDAARSFEDKRIIALARELLSALDALDAARKEVVAETERWERFEAEAEKWRTLYGQAFNDADTLKAERDELQAALDAADGRTEKGEA